MKVKDEKVSFRFDKDYDTFIPYVNDNRGGERYCYSFESYYTEVPMSKMVDDSLSIVPYIVSLNGGKKVAVMEAGAEDYPGMFLKINTSDRHSLVSEFAPYPLEYGVRGRYTVPVKRADYIAATAGTRTFPWRVLAITDRDADFLENDLAQCLAPECRIEDVSWIKPGKTSWEWWSGKHITGVDFRVGTNTETYKYFVDFSADNGLEYVLIDAGWSAGSLMQLRDGFDLREIVDYADSKGVGIVLWCHASSAEKEAAEAFPYYAKFGVKGFKVDFFDADDQRMNGVMYRLAALAAENHLILDLHGMKAFGIQRPYPNVLNFEGVKGLENARWTAVANNQPVDDMPRYDVTAPFGRMLIGPMDYTPGAMDNATARGYRADGSSPMSMGTRVHQMAMYPVFDAPYQMLADSPSKYMREQECTDFIAKVPTVFDRTVALDCKVGAYVAVAREKDGVWYVGAMTDWEARDIEIDCSFLGAGTWKADIFADGVNADRAAEDYAHTTRTVRSGEKIKVHLAPGGGWAAILTR
jgi:alpha-glucosidase